MGVEIASRAKVKHLCMFHNEPTASDSDLDEFLFNTRMYGDIYRSEHQGLHGGPQYPEEISLAYDGLEINDDDKAADSLFIAYYGIRF